MRDITYCLALKRFPGGKIGYIRKSTTSRSNKPHEVEAGSNLGKNTFIIQLILQHRAHLDQHESAMNSNSVRIR